MSHFNYANLQDGDYVFCTSMKPLALGIRQREAGFKRIFDLGVSTHEGRIVSMTAAGVRVVYIAEMIKNQKDKQKGDLKLHPLSSYSPDRGWGDHVVTIKRHPAYSNNMELQQKLVAQILTDWKTGKVDYDTTGCLKWEWPFLKDHKGEYYCSEYSEHIDQTVGGFSCVGLPLDGKHDDVMPYQHQMSEQLNEVKYWKV